MATREMWEAMRAKPHYDGILKDRPYMSNSSESSSSHHLPVYTHISKSLHSMIDERSPKNLANMDEILALEHSLAQARNFKRYIDQYFFKPQRPPAQPTPIPPPQAAPQTFTPQAAPQTAHHFVNPPTQPQRKQFPGRGHRLGGRPGARRFPTSQTDELRVD